MFCIILCTQVNIFIIIFGFKQMDTKVASKQLHCGTDFPRLQSAAAGMDRLLSSPKL